MKFLSHILTYIALGQAETILPDVSYSNAKVIDVDIDVYISDSGRREYSNRMGDIESTIDQVRTKLSNAFSARANSDPTNKYSHFRFNIVIQPEVPDGIDLDECGLTPVEITSQLNLVHSRDSNKHILMFYNCPADTYADQFIHANINYPLISVTDNITCTSRSATFVVPEVTGAELTLANFLMKAAGCPFDNAVSITTEDGGDRGVVLNYFMSHDSYSAMFKNRCGTYN